jgi:Pel9A-like, right handed beta helix region
MHLYLKRTLLVPLAGGLLVALAPLGARAASTYYVAPGGSDSAAGSQAAPWATLAHAQSVAAAGDTVYFRAGTYSYTAGTTTCSSQTATINGVVLNKSGTSGNLIHYWAYPGEVPVFDFSGIKDSCRVKGFDVTGSWIHFKGLEVKGVPQNNNLNHESWGIWISGSNNIFELLNTHHHMGPGLFIQGGSNNLVLNCDSHENYDPMTSNGAGQSADGFGAHEGGSGNVFRGCRAWWNSDDGFDFIHAQEVVTVENSWAWYSGYLPGTTTRTAAGNGNGIKGGGFDLPPTRVPANPPSHIVRNCLSFMNINNGFDANFEPVGDHWYNNTAYMNGANFNMHGTLADGTTANVGILRNNIAFGGTAITNGTGSMVDEAYNSWDSSLGVSVSAADFQSTSITGMDGPRQADGSLPCVPFLRLAQGSDLIDKGQDVGLPFSGSAPDLGAFEYGPCPSGSTGTGGAGGGGTGGAAGGGAGGAAGSAAGGRGGGGTAGRGGTGGAGGAAGAAGTTGAAGRGGAGGAAGSSGGASGSGGGAAGGTTGTAGTSATAGSGGQTGAGGSTGAAGSGSAGTTGAAGTTGTAGTTGAAGTTGSAGTGTPADASGGCGCGVTSNRGGGFDGLAALALLTLALRRRGARRSRGVRFGQPFSEQRSPASSE